jgi:hypothetical protein
MSESEYQLKMAELDLAEDCILRAIEHIQVAGGGEELIDNLKFTLEKGGALDAMRLDLDFKHKQNAKTTN